MSREVSKRFLVTLIDYLTSHTTQEKVLSLGLRQRWKSDIGRGERQERRKIAIIDNTTQKHYFVMMRHPTDRFATA